MILRGLTDKKEYWTIGRNGSLGPNGRDNNRVDASLHWCYKHVQMDMPSISGERHLVPLWSEIRTRVFGGTFPGIQSKLENYKTVRSYCFAFLCPAVQLFSGRTERQTKRLPSALRHPLFFPPSLCVRPIRHYSPPPASHEHSPIVIFPLSPTNNHACSTHSRYPIPITRSDDGRTTTSTNSCHHLPDATRFHLPYLP